MSKFDLDVPCPTRGDKMSRVAIEMPVGGSKLFDNLRDAQRLIYSLIYNRYKCARRKRNMEEHGEVGWRVWKLGDS